MIGMVQAQRAGSQRAASRRQAHRRPRRCSASRRRASRRRARSSKQPGYEVLVFHATGTGGRTMEGLIRDGLVAGVLDITTTELADELVGGVLTAGPDRLTAAALKRVPQVISVGALDMVNFGPPETVPEKFKGRRFHQHNPTVTLMRTTPEEMDRLGKEIAEKASAANGPTARAAAAARRVGDRRRGQVVLVAGGRRGAVPEPAQLGRAGRRRDRTRPAHQRPGVRGGVRGEVAGDDEDED